MLNVAPFRQQPFLYGLDLHRDVTRVRPAVREAAADEPEPFLRGALPHVVHFAVRTEAPHRPYFLRSVLTKELRHYRFLRDETRRQYDEIDRLQRAVFQARTLFLEALDSVVVQQPDLAVDDQLRAAGIEVIAAVTRAHHPLMAGAIFAGAELEAAGDESLV